MERADRFMGCLVGLAVGDALGTTLEFKPPGTFTPLTDMVGGGPFHLKAGQWTDDTSMALCLAESLVERGGFDPLDQMRRYLGWYRHGHWSSTGRCFDIGNTVRTALRRFEETGEAFCGPTEPHSAGNGAIMRLAPVPMFYARAPQRAIEMSGRSAKTTHGAPRCIDACRYLGALIVGALNGVGKEELLSDHYSPVPGYWRQNPLGDEIRQIAAGSFKRKNPPEIRGTGYVVESLEAALWAFYHHDTFEEGSLAAVNLGDDADTTGAVYGQLAGAYGGLSGIRPDWAAKIAMRDEIMDLARRLMEKGPGLEGKEAHDREGNRKG
ncbi:MAG TPA: ADP-ribosylglycohydrolase family protein [Syntrophales bacterium]|nr:ADP-ribosylglycohydrolase family protein [Syntrophales bacterium]HPC01946.1 ADP-ribosylglycohydrolase family protein [Syntrophales bacterium]HRS87827.1 ADP-ribosylglycohydrolase family protein [Syntrophales bacterium]HRV43640.1 ADP-ribosylglycohydrolase family protein [Syntrophales bacterium]